MPVAPACCGIRPPHRACRAYRARLAFLGPRADTGRVSRVVEFLFVLMLPTAAVFALIGAWRLAGWLGEARSKARFKALPPEPVERLEADPRRLRAELEDTETRASLTAKHHRVQALRGAYTDDLSSAFRRPDLRPPLGGARAPPAAIYPPETPLR